jgi:hypothetical protein
MLTDLAQWHNSLLVKIKAKFILMSHMSLNKMQNAISSLSFGYILHYKVQTYFQHTAPNLVSRVL